MRSVASLACLLLLCISAASATCSGAITQSCTLQPYNLQLDGVTFCPNGNANLDAGEVAGSTCADLKYCCAQIDSFSSVASRSVLRVIGISQRIDATSGALTIPSSRSARVEFVRPTCVGRITFSGASSIRVTTYASAATGIATESRDLTSAASEISECGLIALTITAPSDSDVTINSINLCAVGARTDRCGVCNGNSLCPIPGDDSPASVANAPPAGANSGNTKLDARIASENVLSGNTWASSVSTTKDEYFVPKVLCNSRISDDWCFAVWSYDVVNKNTEDEPSCPYAYIPPSRNYFLPSPGYRGQPCVFSINHVNNSDAFGACWQCTKHEQTKLSWILQTQTESFGTVPQHDTATRQADNCPPEYLEWL